MDSRKINQLRSKYPDRIPVLMIKAGGKTGTDLDMDRNKFLVPHDYTMNSLVYVVRKRLPQLQPHQAIFLFVNHSLMPSNTSIQEVYDKYKSTDGLLRITYALENTFG